MKKIILITLYILSLTIGHVLYAQTKDYTTLAPLPGTTKSCTGSTCTADINSYLSGFLNLTITIGAVLAMIYIGLYGFQYAMSDSAPKKSEYKDKLSTIFKGLLLIISAYTIMYTINPKLVNVSLNLESPKLSRISGNTVSVAGTRMTVDQILQSNAVRESLASEGVNTYAGPCEQGQTRGCVNLNGLTDTAKDGLVILKKNCSSCEVLITGGTEGGHSPTGSHPKGLGIDLRPNSQLNTFVGISNPTEGSTKTITINGKPVKFTYETAGGNDQGTSTGDHWHIDF